MASWATANAVPACVSCHLADGAGIPKNFPRVGGQYADYSNLNATLDSLVEEAKRTLQVRLLGDSLPVVSRLEDTIAAFGVKAAREKSWTTSQVLWHIKGSPDLEAGIMDSIDGLTTVVSKTLLVPVP